MTTWLSLLICHCEERSNLNCLHTNTLRGPKTASLFRFARNNRDFTLPRTWYSTILDCFTKEVRNDNLVVFINLSLRGTKQYKLSAYQPS